MVFQFESPPQSLLKFQSGFILSFENLAFKTLHPLGISIMTIHSGEGVRGFTLLGSHTLLSRFLPYLCWLQPLCVFRLQNIVQCCKNFSLFLPLHATLGILLPAPSTPASRTPPISFLPSSCLLFPVFTFISQFHHPNYTNDAFWTLLFLPQVPSSFSRVPTWPSVQPWQNVLLW